MAATTKNRAEEPVMLSPQEVHERTGVALQTLANWRSRDIGPKWVKLTGERNVPGGIVGYREDALAAWLAERDMTAGQLKAALIKRRGRRAGVPA